MVVPKERRPPLRSLHEHRAEILAEAKELGLSGATDFEAAEALGISVMTLNRWKARDPGFASALQLGKDIADGRIEATLYHKARGYTFRSEKIFQHEGRVIRAETIEHVPPSDTAMIFWLKNRQRDKWRDTQNLEADVNVKTDAPDPTQLALALLATMQAAVAQQQAQQAKVIEHDDDE